MTEILLGQKIFPVHTARMGRAGLQSRFPQLPNPSFLTIWYKVIYNFKSCSNYHVSIFFLQPFNTYFVVQEIKLNTFKCFSMEVKSLFHFFFNKVK